MAESERWWERWDDTGVASKIDQYWRETAGEVEHRNQLAELVLAHMRPGEALLDVGCGTGLLYQTLAKKPSSLAYTGIDSSREMLRLARSKHPEGRFLEGDALSLGLRESSFDGVCAFEVFGHLPDPSLALREMYRVASRTVLFTLWTATKSAAREEVVAGSRFIHSDYSAADASEMVKRAIGRAVSTLSRPISDRVTAYVVTKF